MGYELDISDPRSELESAAQLARLTAELQPVGELEILWVREINIHSLRHDVQKLKIATFSLKKLQFIRLCKDDGAIAQALESF